MSRFPWDNTSDDIAANSNPQYETPGGALDKADRAETNAKMYSNTQLEAFRTSPELNIINQSIVERHIRDGAVVSSKIKSKAVSVDKLSDSALDASNHKYIGIVDATTVKEAIDTQQRWIDHIVRNSGDSVIEVVDARVSDTGDTYDTLKERLDTEHTIVGERIDESLNNLRPSAKRKRAMIGFITDDGHTKDLTMLAPIFIAKGVPLTLAIPPNLPGNIGQSYLSDLLTLQDRDGFEIVSHTYNHINLTTIPEEQIEFELTESQNWLRDNGFKGYDIMVYPQGGNNALVRKLTRKYYKCGIGTLPNKGVNEYPFVTYDIARVAFGSYFDPLDDRFPFATNTLDYYKARVDYALENEQWLIFMLHPWHTDHDATQQAHLADLIDYIKSLDIPIVTVNEALKHVGNAVDIGDYHYSNTKSYEVVSCDGVAKSSTIRDVARIVNEKKNLISNYRFEINDLSGHAANNANITIGLDTSVKRSGRHSLKVTRVASQNGYVVSGISNYTQYAGKMISFGAWLMCPKTNSGVFRLGAQDGVSFVLSEPLPNDGQWHFVNIELNVNASPAALQFNTGRVSSNAEATSGDVLYIDSLYACEGEMNSTLRNDLPYISANLERNTNALAGQMGYNEGYLFVTPQNNIIRRVQLANNTEYRAANTFSVTTPIDDFPKDTISVCPITTAYATAQGFPVNEAGYFWTYNLSYDNEFKYQIYETLDGVEYRRKVNPDGSYAGWKTPDNSWIDI